MDDYLNEEKPSTKYAEELFLQILDAVEEAHERGIIHRDLKPANVMMQRTRNKMIPKVCDFGLGKNLAKEGQTRTGQQMGTPAYMAPEQIRSTKDVDQRADIFSLGTILYELLTGHRAFRASNTLDLLNAVASQPHPTPRLYISDLDDRYIQAIDGALTKNAQFRIPDCATFRRVLLGEEDWLVGRPAADENQGGDTLMSLGLDLMGEGTAQSDTAMGFVDNMAAAPHSSLVSERRVHHAPNSPNSTVVQSNPNAQAHAPTTQDTALSESKESKSSKMLLIFGGLLVALAGAAFFLNQEMPTDNALSATAPPSTQEVEKSGTHIVFGTKDHEEPWLNLRAEGSRSGTVIDKIFDGTEVNVLESKKWKYVEVLSTKTKGWVSAKYLRAKARISRSVEEVITKPAVEPYRDRSESRFQNKIYGLKNVQTSLQYPTI